MLHNVVDYFRKQNMSRFFTRAAEKQELGLPKQTLGVHPQLQDEDFERVNFELEVTDKRIAFRAMYFSLAILLVVIVFQYNSFHVSAVENTLQAVSKTITQYSWFLLPLLCGVLTSAFSLFIIYKDSRVPGEDPPTPFSPSHKYRHSFTNKFHMNYICALAVGVLVFAHMLYGRF